MDSCFHEFVLPYDLCIWLGTKYQMAKESGNAKWSLNLGEMLNSMEFVIMQFDSPTYSYSIKNNNKNAMAGQWPDKHWPLCI